MRRAADVRSRTLRVPLVLIAVAVLSACAGSRKAANPDNEPTLASLAGRSVPVDADRRIATSEAQAMAAYRDFLAATAKTPQARPRAEAMRRLGDLELDRAEAAAEALPSAGGASSGAGSAAPAGIDTRAAIARYQERLKAFPQDPGNDQVLYQLARAQELGGDLPASLQTLDRLVAEHPKTVHRAEAQFRRGELLFNARRYPQAEAAYADVLQTDAPLRDRALYMLGWSQFKQSRLPEALQAFFGVLDAKLPLPGDNSSKAAAPASAAAAASGATGDADELAHLSRGDRELLEDTLRVMSISLASLQGAASIPPYIDREARRAYEPRVYRELGELYIRQDRVKDAADTFSAFTRRKPLNAQAPVLQARVIEIYEQGGFAGQALDAKRDYVTRYGADSEFRKANPAGWAQAAPRVKQHLDDLARVHHAAAQKARAARDGATASRETQEAIRWYTAFIEGFPKADETPARHFLLAELLADDQRIADSASAFEQVAYGYPQHARSAEAGYAAVLARRAVAGEPGSAAAATAAGGAARLATDSAVRFATTFPTDPRATAVLTDASDRLMQQGDLDGATRIARQVLAAGADRAASGASTAASGPPQAAAATADQRRVAHAVLGQAAFERKDYAAAEAAYAQALTENATAPNASTDAAVTRRQRDLSERLAAAVYRQGEAARSAGRPDAAIGHFDRVASVAPASTVAAAAQFDSAAVRIEQKDWEGASRTLEDFRQRHAGHPLQAEVPARLALVQMERGQWAAAAVEFERLAAAPSPAALAAAGGDRDAVSRSALYQAAELHERGGDRPRAAQALDRYAKSHPQPAPAAIEARWRLVGLLRAEPALAASLTPAAAATPVAGGSGPTPRAGSRASRPAVAPAVAARSAADAAPARIQALLREIVEADAAAGSSRTDRTRTVAGLARLELTEPQWESYRQVALVEPLQRNLALKKQRMQSLLEAYAAAGGDGASAEVTTAATTRTAALYQDFGRALMGSQRPRGLNKAALEQYNVMLEEQAFPFEEKAIALHEANARRTTQGVYDEAVQQSLTALAALKPVRWGKAERGDPVPAGETAIARAERLGRLEKAAQAAPGDAAAWTRLGLARRQAGRFADARTAYERALSIDPQQAAPTLNLAILHDLYLGEPQRAAGLYERYAALVPAEAATVNRWLAEIRQRQTRAASDVAPAATGPQAQAATPNRETAR